MLKAAASVMDAGAALLGFDSSMLLRQADAEPIQSENPGLSLQFSLHDKGVDGGSDNGECRSEPAAVGVRYQTAFSLTVQAENGLSTCSIS